MKLGLALRNMGRAAEAGVLRAGARAAEAAGLASVWVTDHIAIPPDDAEGSEGRYLDPLTTLAWLAAATDRIRVGTAVLNLPYRPVLPTAKAIATLQELSGGRLQLGVGVGWMAAEFRALGVERRRRGALTDAALEALARYFAADEVEENGQRFLFRPRPARPPILVGGSGAHAHARAVRFGDGWLPMARDPGSLAPEVDALQARARAAGRAPLAVVALTSLPLADAAASRERVAAFAAAGVGELVHGARYDSADAIGEIATALGALARGTPA